MPVAGLVVGAHSRDLGRHGAMTRYLSSPKRGLKSYWAATDSAVLSACKDKIVDPPKQQGWSAG